ncbi:hypothetical protein [Megalodesulfovibrio paquesii]
MSPLVFATSILWLPRSEGLRPLFGRAFGPHARKVLVMLAAMVWALWSQHEAWAQPNQPTGCFSVELLLSMALQEASGGPAPFNATIHAARAGRSQDMTLFVDGPKARLQYGNTAQVERRDLGRLWLFDLEKKTFLDLPLGRDTLPPPALLRQETTLTPQGEEEIDGRKTLKYHVQMPARFFEPQLISPVDDTRYVELTVWHSPELGVMLRRLGPDNATMTMERISQGPQAAELFQIPDGFRKAGLPVSFAK